MEKIEKQIKEYKAEKEKLEKQTDSLKNKKAVAMSEYKTALKNAVDMFPDLDGKKGKEVIEFLTSKYEEVSDKLESDPVNEDTNA